MTDLPTLRHLAAVGPTGDPRAVTIPPGWTVQHSTEGGQSVFVAELVRDGDLTLAAAAATLAELPAAIEAAVQGDAPLPNVADVAMLPTAMCHAEDDGRDLGCSLPAGHEGAHVDDTDTEPAVFLTPDQYDLPPSNSSSWDGGIPPHRGGVLEPLPPTLTDGLTIWGPYGGAQIRLEHALLTDDAGELVRDPDTGGPQLLDAPPVGSLYLAFRDDAPRSDEDGKPYRLSLTEARALRDLLNMATARGAL